MGRFVAPKKIRQLLSVASRAKLSAILAFTSLAFTTSCREGNDKIESGDLGIAAYYQAGTNQTAGRRRIYAIPLSVKVVESESGITVPDMEVLYEQTTSTDAQVPPVVRANSDGYAQAFVRAPSTYSTTVRVQARLKDTVSSTSFYELTTIDPTVMSVDFDPAAMPPPDETYNASNVTPMPSFNVRILDAVGDVVDVNSADTVTLSLRSGTGVLLGTLTKTVSSGIATFNDIRYAKAEPITIRATHNITGHYAEFTTTVLHGNAHHLAFTVPPANPTIAGAEMPIKVTVEDEFNNPVTTGPDSNIAISIALVQGTGPLNGTATMNAYRGVADYTGKGLNLHFVGADKILRASKPASSRSGAFTLDTAVFTVDPAAPRDLDFTGPTPIIAGECAVYGFVTRDAYTNLSPVTANTAINLADGGMAGNFFSDNACTAGNEITAHTMTAGQSSGTVYYQHLVAPDSLTLSVDDGAGGLNADSLAITTTVGPPYKLTISGSSSINSGVCSATAFTVTSRDFYNNVSPVGANTTVDLTGAGNGAFYSAAGCGSSITQVTILNGAATANFYFRDNVSEALTLTADDGPGALVAGSRAVNIL
ncbi:MAG TPA: hypothetical protein VFV50_04210, partial [Bdellovibrionales bacterium]|nr:hypothetical protein [Bdellovibrionales bacterium]